MLVNRYIAVTLMTSLLFSCASAPTSFPYGNTNDKNLTVNLALESGLLTTTNAYAVITDFSDGCPGRYLGYIDLSDGQNSIGLAPGNLTYISIRISHRLLGNRNSMRRGTLFKPQPGQTYELKVSYIDDMFGMTLYRSDRNGRRELPMQTRPSCA